MIKILLTALISAFTASISLGVLTLTPAIVCADQQSGKDDGVSHAQSLMDGVKSLSTDTDVNTIPGYSGTDLPQTEYYENQDIGGLESDAVIGVTTGIANEASQFAYDQATKPKLIFPDNDPILVNANTIGGEAVLNPDLLTIKSGNCATTTGTYTSPELEHCTAWYSPTNHTCSNIRNVDVQWDEDSNCPIGIGFSQRRSLINSGGRDDYVYARAFCNPGLPDNKVSIQVDASDGDSRDCTGWSTLTLSTNEPSLRYSGQILRPRFKDFCTYVPVFIQGACTSGNCSYTATFHEIVRWRWQRDFSTDQFSWQCLYGTSMPLASLGLNRGALPTGTWEQSGNYCARHSASVSINFIKPEITRTPIVTDTWNNACAGYEAQVD